MLQRSISRFLIAAFVWQWRSLEKFETLDDKPETLYSQNENYYKKTKSACL